MSAASSALRRTLLTSLRSRPTLTTPTTRTTPAFRQTTRTPISKTSFRSFSVTMGKEGVHNLKNKAEFDEAMTTKDTLMVVDCFATWCGPCKVIAPQVVKYASTPPPIPLLFAQSLTEWFFAGTPTPTPMPAFTSSTSTRSRKLRRSWPCAPCLPSSSSRTAIRSARWLVRTPRRWRRLSRTTCRVAIRSFSEADAHGHCVRVAEVKRGWHAQ